NGSVERGVAADGESRPVVERERTVTESAAGADGKRALFDDGAAGVGVPAIAERECAAARDVERAVGHAVLDETRECILAGKIDRRCAGKLDRLAERESAAEFKRGAVVEGKSTGANLGGCVDRQRALLDDGSAGIAVGGTGENDLASAGDIERA